MSAGLLASTRDAGHHGAAVVPDDAGDRLRVGGAG